MMNNATEQASDRLGNAWRDGAVLPHPIDAIRATRETRSAAPILPGEAVRADSGVIGAVELRCA